MLTYFTCLMASVQRTSQPLHSTCLHAACHLPSVASAGQEPAVLPVPPGSGLPQRCLNCGTIQAAHTHTPTHHTPTPHPTPTHTWMARTPHGCAQHLATCACRRCCLYLHLCPACHIACAPPDILLAAQARQGPGDAQAYLSCSRLGIWTPTLKVRPANARTRLMRTKARRNATSDWTRQDDGACEQKTVWLAPR